MVYTDKHRQYINKWRTENPEISRESLLKAKRKYYEKNKEKLRAENLANYYKRKALKKAEAEEALAVASLELPEPEEN